MIPRATGGSPRARGPGRRATFLVTTSPNSSRSRRNRESRWQLQLNHFRRYVLSSRSTEIIETNTNVVCAITMYVHVNIYSRQTGTPKVLSYCYDSFANNVFKNVELAHAIENC